MHNTIQLLQYFQTVSLVKIAALADAIITEAIVEDNGKENVTYTIITLL